MAAPEAHRLLAAALLAVAGGCAGTSEPDFAERQTEAKDAIEATKQAASEGEAASLPEPIDPDVETPREPPATEVAVKSGAPVHFKTAPAGPEAAPEQPSLFEAAEKERDRRQDGGSTSAVIITNANLEDFAKGGSLSEMAPDNIEAEANPSGKAAGAEEDRETYWRTRARDARLAWRAAHDRVGELEKEVARLRFEFYSQDDPAYRDREIKPAWDRTSVELSQARLRVADLEAQVERVLQEGQQDAALPGWLREGIDYEPERSDEGRPQSNELGISEAIEPPILEDPPL